MEPPAVTLPGEGIEGTVTLITGDRVTVHGGKVGIAPGKGRRGLQISVTRHRDELLVIPADVRSGLAAGRFDRRLFDVAGLIKAGYGDDRTQATPLLVTGRTARTPLPKATSIKALPAIRGTALKVGKSDGAAFLAALGPAKLWLDGQRHLTLDESVPQIGAPAAWQAGYTGKGVKVAVLDTGIDATHPDLADRVGAAKNFTEEVADDLVGHGTHVASTVAGTAKASAGRYKGVAPDATLLDGKVCERRGCSESAMLAGMEWAATEQRAQIVNMSIGGENTPEIDPIEEAVNRLTAETGTLFVIGAGNSGPGAGSIDSPGSAEAALTVGAVDKQDRIAEFSSRGPSRDGGALKPDVTAPGVSIVAAKAKNTSIGETVGTQYVRLDGTSMATPHVAGAAALLAQQHTDWKAGRLKAALMASAKPIDQQTSFDQGAGRVDLSRAIHQDVTTEPAGVSFGTAAWPHNDDQPVVKQLTYRNQGTQPLTLQLSTSFVNAVGDPAPAGSLSLSATTVTVPGNGSATVTLTSNTNHDGPDGGYSGRVTATAGETKVVTPIGADKEVETYTLTLNYTGPDGKPATQASGYLLGLDNLFGGAIYIEAGTVKYRLPRGRYAAEAAIDVEGSEGSEDSYQLVRPDIMLDRDLTVDFDARRAKLVSATIDRPDADLSSTVLGYYLGTDQSFVTNTSYVRGRLFTAQLGGTAASTRLETHLVFQWGEAGPDGEFYDSPYTYSTLNERHHGFFTGFHRAVRERDLVKVVSTYRRQARDSDLERWVYHYGGTRNLSGMLLGMGFPLRQRNTVVNFVDPGPVRWADWVEEYPASGTGQPVTTQIGQDVVRTRGRTADETWNGAPFAPAFGLYDGALLATRGFVVSVSGYGDSSPGRAGLSATDTASTVAYRNGVKFAESGEFGYVEAGPQPAGRATYQLVSKATRPSISDFSTETENVWTFPATVGDEVQQLPLRTVRFRPTLDLANSTARRPVLVIPFQLETQAGVSLPAAKKVELQVSGDDGRTWQRAVVVPAGKNSYRAIVRTPAGAKYVGLRSKVTDKDGSTADLTVLRAFGLRG
ncbi:S8 family serine peptidase [Kribbella sp. NPDC056861]|uniref:S8 family serine peptidase n=1 Tax=Kribbella sp. NPDC056861 TaxID=3154857 RepID=UPI00341558E8